MIFGDLLQTAEQIIGIDDDKAAGAIGELIENLLIVRSAGRKWRNDLPGLIVGIVQATVRPAAGSTTAGFAAATSSTSALTAATGSTSAGSTSTGSTSAMTTACLLYTSRCV